MKKNILVPLLVISISFLGCQKSTTPTSTEDSTTTLVNYVDVEYDENLPVFPHDTENKVKRDIVTFYSPDDLYAHLDLEMLGYPDGWYFKLHSLFPKVKYTTQFVIANRYIELNMPDATSNNLKDAPETQEMLLDMEQKEEFNSWMEIGFHGLTHSPVDDPDYDHHEFSGVQNPNANDYDWNMGVFDEIRETFENVGLDNKKIIVGRFPGYQYTVQTLEAMSEHQFLAFFGQSQLGEEKWIYLPTKKDFLEIPDMEIALEYNPNALQEKIIAGEITNDNLKESSEYIAALNDVKNAVDTRINSGGIVNFFNHWWEPNNCAGLSVNYCMPMFVDILSYIDTEYESRVWWGFGSEVAKWIHVKKYIQVSLNEDSTETILNFSIPKDCTISQDEILMSYNYKSPTHNSLEIKVDGLWEPLDSKQYWKEDGIFHFNFNFSGETMIKFVE